jgi:hypothetical protein
MRFVIINHAYDEFLDWLYRSSPGLERRSFASQLHAYYETLFASSDFYAHALKTLGHEVDEFVVNNGSAQRAWLDEHRSPRLRNWLSRIVGQSTAGEAWFEALLQQVRYVRPDVIFNQSVYAFDNQQLNEKACEGLGW